MERLSELAAAYSVRFPELRFLRPNRCVKVIGDAAYGFEFMRIRGQYKTFFAGYSLWDEIKKSGLPESRFFQEVTDSRGLQVPYQLQNIEVVLARLLDGSEHFIKPKLSGDILFDDFSKFVERTLTGVLFRHFSWEKVNLLRLALRTSSFIGRRDAAIGFRDRIIRCSDELKLIGTIVPFDYAFGGDKSWLTLLEREIELGLAGNPIVETNREILRNKGLVISEILAS